MANAPKKGSKKTRKNKGNSHLNPKSIGRQISELKTCDKNQLNGQTADLIAGLARESSLDLLLSHFHEIDNFRRGPNVIAVRQKAFTNLGFIILKKLKSISGSDATSGLSYSVAERCAEETNCKNYFLEEGSFPEEWDPEKYVPHLPGNPAQYATKANLEEELKKVRDLLAEKFQLVPDKLEELDDKIANILQAVGDSKCSGLKKSDMMDEIQHLIVALSSGDGKNVTITGPNAAEVSEAVKSVLDEFERKITEALEAVVKSKEGGVTAAELESALQRHGTAKETFQKSMENWFEGRIAELKKIWNDTFVSQFKGVMKAEMPAPGISWVSVVNLVLLVVLGIFVSYSQFADRDRVVANSNELSSISAAVDKSARQDSIQNSQIEVLDEILRDIAERAGANSDSLPSKVYNPYLREKLKPFVRPAEEPPAENKKTDSVETDKKDTVKK